MRTLESTALPSSADILALVPIATVKANLRIVHTREDARVSDCILFAFAYFDGQYGYLRRSILPSQWVMTLPGFMKPGARADHHDVARTRWTISDVIDIPLPPLRSVDRIRYRQASDGAWQTLYAPNDSMPVTSDVLFVQPSEANFGRIHLLDQKAWPDTVVHPGAVEISFTAGWASAADVMLKASGIARAIAILAADFYENPVDTRDDVRSIVINRKIANGIERSAGRYRFFLDMGYG